MPNNLDEIEARAKKDYEIWKDRHCLFRLEAEEALALVAELRQLREAARWHYPEREDESEKFPTPGGTVLAQTKFDATREYGPLFLATVHDMDFWHRCAYKGGCRCRWRHVDEDTP